MIRRPPRSTRVRSSAASDVYKRQGRAALVHVGGSGGAGRAGRQRAAAAPRPRPGSAGRGRIHRHPRPMTGPMPSGIVFVLVAALLWGTTGTAAAMASGVGPLAIGAAAMGIGGLLQAAAASRVMFTHRGELTAQWPTVMVSAGAVAVFPLAFYSSMRLAGVAVGTVVSIGWALRTTVGVSGVLAIALAHPGQLGPVTTTATAQPVPGIALGLLAGVTYAIYSWGAVRVMRCGLPSRPVMGAVFGLGGILLLPVLALTGAPIITSGSNLAVAAYLAIVPMFLGYIL